MLIAKRTMATIGGLAIALALDTADAARATAVRGVMVEANVARVRWLGFVPSTTVRFEVAIYVDRSVPAFSAVHYECRFAGGAANEAALVSSGIAARDSFAVVEDGRLVSRAREELMNREPVDVTCRATKLDK